MNGDEIPRRTIKVWAIANKPNEGKSVLDWCPFKDDQPLYKIQNSQNQKNIDEVNKWIVKLPVLLIDIDPRDLTRINEFNEQFIKDISIILIDNEAFHREISVNKNKFKHQKDYMLITKKKYIIAPVSRKQDASSEDDEHKELLDYFEGIPIGPSDLRIYRNQKCLEDFFADYCDFQLVTQRSLSDITLIIDPLLKTNPSIIAEYRKNIPMISADVANEAYDQRLQKPQIADSLLKHLGSAFENLKPEIQLEDATLLYLELSPLQAEPTNNQSKILEDLGLMAGTNFSIQLNEPKLLAEVEKMGDMIQSQEISARLPSL